MTFPVYQSRSNSSGTPTGTSFPVTLPSGATTGDLVLVIFTTAFSTTSTASITSGTGWTFVGPRRGGSGGTGYPGVYYGWKILDGSGDTPTITTSASGARHDVWAASGAPIAVTSGAYSLDRPAGAYRIAFFKDSQAPVFYPSGQDLTTATSLSVSAGQTTTANITRFVRIGRTPHPGCCVGSITVYDACRGLSYPAAATTLPRFPLGEWQEDLGPRLVSAAGLAGPRTRR